MAEEIDQGNKIILSKIGRGNELRNLTRSAPQISEDKKLQDQLQYSHHGGKNEKL